MMNATQMLEEIRKGDRQILAKSISIIENETEGYEDVLHALKFEKRIPVIGITGPAGAGKSTLLNAIIDFLVSKNKKIGVVAVDPSSPFTQGALLGDRVRMSSHFLNSSVYIRSIATRGSLGGLSEKIIEITDLLRHADFDFIFVETVGVGQSEVEIASLADTTLLVLVPGAGDDVQTLKSGIMEIADLFVVNKADREGADGLIKNILEHLDLKKFSGWIPPVVKTVATKSEGVEEVINKIDEHIEINKKSNHVQQYARQAFRLISRERMKDVNEKKLEQEIYEALLKNDFNLYRFVGNYQSKTKK